MDKENLICLHNGILSSLENDIASFATSTNLEDIMVNEIGLAQKDKCKIAHLHVNLKILISWEKR